MKDCIFCKIVKGEIPTTKIYEDADVLAFKDINPIMPFHVLVIPKKHIANFLEIEDSEILIKIQQVIKNIAQKYNLDKEGFNIINNCGEKAGQTVFHLHFHLLSGKNLLTMIKR